MSENNEKVGLRDAMEIITGVATLIPGAEGVAVVGSVATAVAGVVDKVIDEEADNMKVDNTKVDNGNTNSTLEKYRRRKEELKKAKRDKESTGYNRVRSQEVKREPKTELADKDIKKVDEKPKRDPVLVKYNACPNLVLYGVQRYCKSERPGHPDRIDKDKVHKICLCDFNKLDRDERPNPDEIAAYESCPFFDDSLYRR